MQVLKNKVEFSKDNSLSPSKTYFYFTMNINYNKNQRLLHKGFKIKDEIINKKNIKHSYQF